MHFEVQEGKPQHLKRGRQGVMQDKWTDEGVGRVAAKAS